MKAVTERPKNKAERFFKFLVEDFIRNIGCTKEKNKSSRRDVNPILAIIIGSM
jgi:hypothetical protein